MPDSPARKKRRVRKFRYPAPLPAPRFSACLYVRLAPKDVAMFRFLLEAEENLAYMTTVDRWSSVLRLVFSPHQEVAVRCWLHALQGDLAFTLLEIPRERRQPSV